MLLQLHFLSLILVPFVGVNAQDCYANLTDPYSLFATKTGYFKVDNEETDEIKFPGNLLRENRFDNGKNSENFFILMRL